MFTQFCFSQRAAFILQALHKYSRKISQSSFECFEQPGLSKSLFISYILICYFLPELTVFHLNRTFQCWNQTRCVCPRCALPLFTYFKSFSFSCPFQCSFFFLSLYYTGCSLCSFHHPPGYGAHGRPCLYAHKKRHIKANRPTQ